MLASESLSARNPLGILLRVLRIGHGLNQEALADDRYQSQLYLAH